MKTHHNKNQELYHINKHIKTRQPLLILKINQPSRPDKKEKLGYFYAVDFKVKDYEIYYIKNYSTTGVSKFVAILLRSGNSHH